MNSWKRAVLSVICFCGSVCSAQEYTLNEDQLKCRIWKLEAQWNSNNLAWYVDSSTLKVVFQSEYTNIVTWDTRVDPTSKGAALFYTAFAQPNVPILQFADGTRKNPKPSCAIYGVDNTLPASEIKNYLEVAMSLVVRNAVNAELAKLVKTITDTSKADMEVAVAAKIKALPNDPDLIEGLRLVLEEKLNPK